MQVNVFCQWFVIVLFVTGAVVNVSAHDPDVVNDEFVPDPPRTFTVSPEIDAARLLSQATFGTSPAALEAVALLGGAEEWIDQQLSLPVSSHLPIVQQRFPDGWGTQQGRYYGFWELALRAEDQLRQRVAFALSEIMVVSDIPDAMINHGNLLAAYYDILVNYGLGSYRELLQQVTLNPAMGIYLSMLGNEKPDPATGRRADENYAREVMQLFSIGLVMLNQDGTVMLDAEGNPIPTYRQTDVENLANTLTGWSWDTPDWQVSAVAGWYPDMRRMERSMKSFPAHHHTGAKAFLEVSLPAGQSPEEDLNAAMDTLFNHPNVGPFIGKQLIQRLVTSNPSPSYVERVASVFNDNGDGVRGDLGAVVKAILMDYEARSADVASLDSFGKLREPILRFSHIWRAFRVQDPIEMGFFAHQISQHAPLTAKSVFNFFSPTYSPAGSLSEAGLVAPEFQINTESWVNEVNGALMWIIQQESFYGLFPTALNLSVEEGLMATPERLLDHLNLLLLSGGMSAGLRELLLDYTNLNVPIVGADRVLRDVIALIMTSAEYTVQR